eukprot:scaffold144082_cov31-Prasinocladus_malaysianus.AAC.2
MHLIDQLTAHYWRAGAGRLRAPGRSQEGPPLSWLTTQYSILFASMYMVHIRFTNKKEIVELKSRGGVCATQQIESAPCAKRQNG